MEELRARVRELQQKLEVAEQAVDDKEQELRDVRKALVEVKEDAATRAGIGGGEGLCEQRGDI